MYTWTEVCTGVYSLNPDHCRPHRSPAGVVDGEVIASGLKMLKGIQASGLPLSGKGTHMHKWKTVGFPSESADPRKHKPKNVQAEV